MAVDPAPTPGSEHEVARTLARHPKAHPVAVESLRDAAREASSKARRAREALGTLRGPGTSYGEAIRAIAEAHERAAEVYREALDRVLAIADAEGAA